MLWVWIIGGLVLAIVIAGIVGDERDETERKQDTTIGWCRRCEHYTPPDYTQRRAGFREGECSWGSWPWTHPNAGRGCPGYKYDAEQDGTGRTGGAGEGGGA